MFCRVVYSRNEYQELISDCSNVLVAPDIREIDDFICVKNQGIITKVIALNLARFVELQTSCCYRESYYGVIIDLENYVEVYEDSIIEKYAKGGKRMSEIGLDEIVEEQVGYCDDDLYNINSWGADLSFREIINMYDDDELLKPELQRKYVWTKPEASRFIDSILLGLPVPSVFFAKEPNETMLIIDGFQRIMTVYDFVRGVFSGDGKVFKLSNTENINKRWRGKTFAELELEEKRRIRNTTIHAIIFEQKHPRNDTGMFQVFERINTGGRTLKAQEIRNCVYQGKCNDLLFRLNKCKEWREILGLESEDARMADLELILRFFAMNELKDREESKVKQINLAKYLNHYMSDKTKEDAQEIERLEKLFLSMVKSCKQIYGNAAFKNLKKDSVTEFTTKINPAIFDAISVATSYALEKQVLDENVNYKELYCKLLVDEDFANAASNRTTNVENIMKRISMASEQIYGIKYE